jgi:hypothetical protein
MRESITSGRVLPSKISYPAEHSFTVSEITTHQTKLNDAVGIIEDSRKRAFVKDDIQDKLAEKLIHNPDFMAEALRQNPLGEGEDLLSILTGAGKESATLDDARYTARRYIDQWAAVSADHDSYALAMQMAAKDEFGLTLARAAAPEYFMQNAQSIYAQEGKAMRAFLREMHGQTQEWFKSNGIKRVRLFRGMVFDEVPNDLPEIKWDGTRSRIGITSQPLSSYSSDSDAALYFTQPEAKAKFNAVVYSDIPVDRIVSTCNTGFGAKNFGEFVVKGGADNVDIVGWMRDTLDKPSSGANIIKRLAAK